MTIPFRSFIVALLFALSVFPMSDAGASDLQYDRFAIGIGAKGATLLWGLREGNHAGSVTPIEVFVAYRMHEQSALSLFVSIGLFSAQGGLAYQHSFRGWHSSGLQLDITASVVSYGINCEFDEECLADSVNRIATGRGFQSDILFGYRWSLRDGGAGLLAGIGLHGAWLDATEGKIEGPYLGFSPVRVVFDW